MLKVCVVCYPNYPSKKTGRGQDRYSYELLKQLRLRGIDPIVLEQGTVGNFLEYAIKDLKIFSKIINIETDLFHAASEYGAKYLFLMKSPVVTTIHDMLPYFFFSKAPALYFNQRICFRLASKSDKIIVSSQFYLELVRRILKVPLEKIRVIHHGVDHQFFTPIPKNRRVWKDHKIIFYTGGLSRMKGAATLIRAFSVVAKEMKDVDLLIGGEGKDFTLLQTIANRLKIRDRVRFLGFIKEEVLSRYYNLADVFVWPSHFGFGLAILEAMACGTPVIVSNAFDASEYVGDAGILFEPGNVRQLADSLLYILENEDVRRSYSRKAIKRAGLFSWQKTVKETLKVYNELLSTS